MNEKVRHLRQNGSNHIYVWTPELAKRSDMVECEFTPPVPVPATPPSAPAGDAKVAAPVVTQDAPPAGQPPGEVFDFEVMDETALRAFAESRSISIPGTIKKVETLRDFVKKACE